MKQKLWLYVCPCISWVLEYPKRSAVRQMAPDELAVPNPTIGSFRELHALFGKSVNYTITNTQSLKHKTWGLAIIASNGTELWLDTYTWLIMLMSA